jgi:hypothetical protein
MPTYTPPPPQNNNLATAAAAVVQAVNNHTDAGEVSIDTHAIGECETCNNRRYQDDSLDGGVSFQTPTRIHPSEAATAVIGHEREHQGREARFAQEDGREVIFNEIEIHTSLCPDCGRVYVSGGVTNTMTREYDNPEDQPMSLLDVLANRRI